MMIASMVLLAGVTVATSWDGKAPVPEFVMRDARILRECVMSDPHRPLYHFTMLDGDAMPGDSNGAFWANGRYHLFYLYARPEGAAQCDNRIVNRSFSWGHVSSADLLHWRHHPDCLGVGDGDVKNVRISHCRFPETAGCIGFTCAWIAGKRNVHVSDVAVSDCVFEDSATGVEFQTAHNDSPSAIDGIMELGSSPAKATAFKCKFH